MKQVSLFGGNLIFVRSEQLGFFMIIRGHMYFPRIPGLKRLLGLVSKVRNYLPMWYTRGLHDCDSGGRCFIVYRDFSWRAKDAYSVDHGDGPDSITPIGPIQWLVLPRSYRSQDVNVVKRFGLYFIEVNHE